MIPLLKLNVFVNFVRNVFSFSELQLESEEKQGMDLHG